MTQRFWWLVGGCLLLTSLTISARAVVRRHGQPLERTFQLRYSASITDLPAQASEIRIWVPLARTRDNQRIVSRQIHVEHPYEIHEEPTFGNHVLYLHLIPPIPQPLELHVDYEAVVSSISSEEMSRGGPPGRLASETQLAGALRDEPLMVTNVTTTRLAKEATAGQTTELGRARALYDYVLSHMSYDKTVPGWGRGDTLRACQLGKGNCTDFHSLFISLARSIGIPAQFVIGAPIPEGPEGEIPGYHCWAQFYSAEDGWVPIDISEAWKHPDLREYYFGSADPNRLLISVGRNLQLVPAQAGSPVNIFIHPYVEVDGHTGATVETRFWFRSHTYKSHDAQTYGAKRT